MNSFPIAITAISAYLISGTLIGARLFGTSRQRQIHRLLGIGIGLLGVLLHALLLYGHIVSYNGISFGFFDAASLVAWTILLLLMLSSLSKPVENLGIAILPLAALTILLQLKYPATARLLTAETPLGLRFHVVMSLLAYSLLAMASVQAILLAVQDHHLRHRHPGGFIRALPPLQTMEALLFEMIGLGFTLLTIALISGFMFLEDMFAQRLAHKTILSIVAWAVFGTLLWGRFRRGWRGQMALIWTLAGFVVLMLAYFGSKFVIELILVNG
ncbi:MAG: cytochrome c biogenesis protein CcsA [Gammaproteobacteria bacterium]|nr:cytochrome c biogenesis protein CcsA [Gammaproteobacteria bacterium]